MLIERKIVLDFSSILRARLRRMAETGYFFCGDWRAFRFIFTAKIAVISKTRQAAVSLIGSIQKVIVFESLFVERVAFRLPIKGFLTSGQWEFSKQLIFLWE